MVRFISRDLRDELFYSKKSLKGTGYSISEHLTSYNIDLLRYAKEVVGRNNAWSDQGMIYINTPNRKKVLIRNKDDVPVPFRPAPEMPSNSVIQHESSSSSTEVNLSRSSDAEHHAAMNKVINNYTADFPPPSMPIPPNKSHKKQYSQALQSKGGKGVRK